MMIQQFPPFIIIVTAFLLDSFSKSLDWQQVVQAFENGKIVNWQQVVQNFRLAAGGEAKMDQFSTSVESWSKKLAHRKKSTILRILTRNFGYQIAA